MTPDPLREALERIQAELARPYTPDPSVIQTVTMKREDLQAVVRAALASQPVTRGQEADEHGPEEPESGPPGIRCKCGSDWGPFGCEAALRGQVREGIDEAWAEAEAALPEGWGIGIHPQGNLYLVGASEDQEWKVSAAEFTLPAALRALTLALQGLSGGEGE